MIAKCVAEASISELCAFGDSLIEAEAKKVFTKDKKMEKGVAFPTCLSVNNVVGHYSPLKSEDAQLKAGDLVKIDLGCHIDGFVGLVAHTVVVGAEALAGPKADVLLAAYDSRGISHLVDLGGGAGGGAAGAGGKAEHSGR